MADSTPRGFEGFMACTTDVAAAIAAADRIITSSPPVAAHVPRPSASQSRPAHRDSGAVAGGLKKIIGWVVGIGLIVAIRAFIFTGVHTLTSSPSTSAEAPAIVEAPAPTEVPPVVEAPAIADSQPTATNSKPSSDWADDGVTRAKPDVGTATLSLPELRYCIAERIRIAAERSEMDNIQNSDVERFNRHVDDFNSTITDTKARCVDRYYLENEKALADSQVEAQRAALEAEGRARID